MRPSNDGARGYLEQGCDLVSDEVLGVPLHGSNTTQETWVPQLLHGLRQMSGFALKSLP